MGTNDTTIEERRLLRLTIEQLVTLAFDEGCGERAIISEWKGPYPKSIIVHEIIKNRRRNEAILNELEDQEINKQ